MFNHKDPLDKAVLMSIAVFGTGLIALSGWQALNRTDPQVTEAPAMQEQPVDSETAMTEPTAEPDPAPTQTADAEPTETEAAQAPTPEATATGDTESAVAELAPVEPDAPEAAAADPAPAENANPAMVAAEPDMAEPEPDIAAAEPNMADDAQDSAANSAAAQETVAAGAAPKGPAAPETAAASADGWSDVQLAYLDGDADAGAQFWKQCRACHVAEEEQNRVGPHLVNIVGREAASIDGFRYSQALQGLQGQEWTPEALDAWLTNPRTYAKGTSMVYRGIPDGADRANLLAYLWSLQN